MKIRLVDKFNKQWIWCPACCESTRILSRVYEIYTGLIWKASTGRYREDCICCGSTLEFTADCVHNEKIESGHITAVEAGEQVQSQCDKVDSNTVGKLVKIANFKIRKKIKTMTSMPGGDIQVILDYRDHPEFQTLQNQEFTKNWREFKKTMLRYGFGIGTESVPALNENEWELETVLTIPLAVFREASMKARIAQW